MDHPRRLVRICLAVALAWSGLLVAYTAFRDPPVWLVLMGISISALYLGLAWDHHRRSRGRTRAASSDEIPDGPTR